MVTKLFNNAVLGIIGFILSTYSVYVEHKVEHKDDSPDGGEYEALCDIEVRVNHHSVPMCHSFLSPILPSIYKLLFSLSNDVILTGDWSKLQVRA